MWKSRAALLEALTVLKSENSDLRAQVRFLTQSAHDRETKLIDRILAVSHPAAVREVNPRPPRETPQSPGNTEHRINFPGVGMTPPPPPTPKILVTEPEEPDDAN